jgi:hypothetical protein
VDAKFPDVPTVDNGWVFFEADSPDGRDAYGTPCSGGPVTRLTSSGRVAYPMAANGLLAWQEPIQGDPTSVWVKAEGSAEAAPIRLTGDRNQGNVVTGRGFVLWLDGTGQLVVRDSGARAAAATLPNQDHLSIAARWTTHDDMLAWVNEDSTNARYTLYTATVALP